MNLLNEVVGLLKSERLTQTKLTDQTGVVLDLDGLRVYSFNETAMFIVEQLSAGVADEATLVSRVVAEFDVDETTARQDLEEFLAKFSRMLEGKKH